MGDYKMIARKLIFIIIISSSISCSIYKYEMEIVIQNNRNTPIDVTFPKGLIFETKYPRKNPQNLILLESYQFMLEPNEKRKVIIPGYCINQPKNPPTNQSIRPTPLYVDPNTFKSNRDIWRHLESLRNR